MRNKLTSLVFLLIIIVSCIAQKETFERKIDINNFESKTYYTEDSAYIEQFTWGGGYGRKISQKDSLYLNFYNYYDGGNIKYRGKSIRHGSGSFGVWYYYDEKGNLINIRDKDEEKGYTFKFEDVLAYAKKNNIDLHKASIYKSDGWVIAYTGYFEGEYNTYRILLDKQTGEKDITVGFGGRTQQDPITGGSMGVYDTLYYKGVRYPRE